MKGPAKGFSTLLMTTTSLLLALIVNGLVLKAFGFHPFSVYGAIFTGAAGSSQASLQTLSQSTLLMLTGLAFSVSFKAGLINIGAEGQLYMGAIVGTLAGIYLPLPGLLHKAIVIAVAGLAGALWSMLAGYLKVRFNANEVITTIMLNTIAVNFCSYLVNYPMKASELVAQSARLRDTAIIQRLDPATQFNITFFLAVAIVVLVDIIINHTVFGFEIRATGQNGPAAKAAGINVSRTTMAAMGISGAIAGFAGIFQVMSINYCLIDNFSSGYGFSGVAVSALSGGNIYAVILSGILFAILKNGAMLVQRMSRVPLDFVQILQALVIVFVAAPELVKIFGGVFRNTNRVIGKLLTFTRKKGASRQ